MECTTLIINKNSNKINQINKINILLKEQTKFFLILTAFKRAFFNAISVVSNGNLKLLIEFIRLIPSFVF